MEFAVEWNESPINASAAKCSILAGVESAPSPISTAEASLERPAQDSHCYDELGLPRLHSSPAPEHGSDFSVVQLVSTPQARVDLEGLAPYTSRFGSSAKYGNGLQSI